MSSVTPSGPGPAPDDSVQETMVERGEVPPNVPNLLRVSPMDTTTATDVETSILDPVVTSDSFCRFVFLNKGILHSHSKVTLAITSPDAVKRFYPTNVGVASLISRASLKVGTKTLQEIDGYNFLTAYKSLFISNEHQKEREQVQTGRSQVVGALCQSGPLEMCTVEEKNRPTVLLYYHLGCGPNGSRSHYDYCPGGCE